MSLFNIKYIKRCICTHEITYYMKKRTNTSSLCNGIHSTVCWVANQWHTAKIKMKNQHKRINPPNKKLFSLSLYILYVIIIIIMTISSTALKREEQTQRTRLYVFVHIYERARERGEDRLLSGVFCWWALWCIINSI